MSSRGHKTHFFWNAFNIVFGWAAVALSFFLLALLAHVEIRDLDLWFHIGAGRTILETHAIPRVDVFSHTMSGRPWVDHEWLFQVLVAWLYDRWGADGLIWMQEAVTLTIAGIMMLFFFPWRRLLLGVFAFIAVIMVFPVRLTHRPDLFSLLFLTLYTCALWGDAIRRRWMVVVLFVIQILWTNMHGFFALGVLFVWLTAFSEFLKRRVPLFWRWNRVYRYDDQSYRNVCLLSILLPLACLINPYLWQGAFYPFQVVFQGLSGQQKAFFSNIVELQKPWGGDVLDMDRYGFYKMMVLLSAALFYYNRRRIDLKHIFIWGLLLAFSCSASRNLMYFMIIAFVVTCHYIRPLSLIHIAPIRIMDSSFKFLITAGLKAYLCFWLVLQIQSRSLDGYFDFETGRRKHAWSGVSTRAYPSKAVRFLKQQGFQGRIFNDFNSGAYLIGHVYPKIRVFIDGRAEFYGQDFFNRLIEIHRHDDVGLLEQMIDRHPIDMAFINTHYGAWPPKNVIDYFNHWPGWRLVYLDDDGLIFINTNNGLRDRWNEIDSIDIRRWCVKRYFLPTIASALVPSYPWIKRAVILYQLEAYDAALAEIAEGLKHEPDNEALYRIRGLVYLDLKRYELALEDFRRSVVLNRNDYVSFWGLARSLWHLRQWEAAKREFLKLRRKWKNSPDPIYYLAQMAVISGEVEESRRFIQEARKRETTHYEKTSVDGWISLAKAWAVRGDLRQMEAMMQEAYRRRPSDPFVHLVHGEIYERLGHLRAARRLWRQGLRKAKRFHPLYERLWLTNAAVKNKKIF